MPTRSTSPQRSIDVPGDLVVATWDQELAAAAVAEGRMVVPAQP